MASCGVEEKSAEIMALHRLDESSKKLQREGKYLQALELMERALVLRQHFFGADSTHVWTACKTVSELCNLLAMTYLQQEQYKFSFELLKKAEILSQKNHRMKAVTYNNLGCFYRRKGKLHAAFKYLQQAIDVETKHCNELGQTEDRNETERQARWTQVKQLNRSDTHLNLCAVLSQLGRHSGALEHAQTAMILLQEELFGCDKRGNTEQDDQMFNFLEDQETARMSKDRVAVLAIAYHNIGVEQEFLRKSEGAVDSYRKGYDVSEQYLGNKHGITLTLRHSYTVAKRALALKISKTPTRISHPNFFDAKYEKHMLQQLERKDKAYMRNLKELVYEKQYRAIEGNNKKWESIEKAYGCIAKEIRPLKSLARAKHKTAKQKGRRKKGGTGTRGARGEAGDSQQLSSSMSQFSALPASTTSLQNEGFITKETLSSSSIQTAKMEAEGVMPMTETARESDKASDAPVVTSPLPVIATTSETNQLASASEMSYFASFEKSVSLQHSTIEETEQEQEPTSRTSTPLLHQDADIKDDQSIESNVPTVAPPALQASFSSVDEQPPSDPHRETLFEYLSQEEDTELEADLIEV